MQKQIQLSKNYARTTKEYELPSVNDTTSHVAHSVVSRNVSDIS